MENTKKVNKIESMIAAQEITISKLTSSERTITKQLEELRFQTALIIIILITFFACNVVK